VSQPIPGYPYGPPPQGPPAGRPGMNPQLISMVLVGATLLFAILNVIFGFLTAFTITGQREVDYGTVYTMAGWAPVLSLVVGLLAVATLLRPSDKGLLWLVSAAVAVSMGFGVLFTLVAGAGVEELVGNVTSSAAAGLILVLIFGLLQALVTIAAVFITGRPGGVGAVGGRPQGQPPGGSVPQPEPQAYPPPGYGPPPGYPPQSQGYPGQGYPGGPQYPPPSAGSPTYPAPPPTGQGNAPQRMVTESEPPRSPAPPPAVPPAPAPRAPASRPSAPAAAPARAAGSSWSPPPPPAWVTEASSQGGSSPSTQGGASASGSHAAGPAGRLEPATASAGESAVPGRAGGVAGPTLVRAAAAAVPAVYDPQSGTTVRSGLFESQPARHPEPPQPPTPTASPELLAPAQPAPPAEYKRTEYGSDDYDWEPTYSEAPGYEESTAQRPARPPVKPEQAYMYDTPEWERPQSEPPRFDSGRLQAWNTRPGQTATAPETDVRLPWRSIPRAE
jgi:Family of unknown function (DUF5336)